MRVLLTLAAVAATALLLAMPATAQTPETANCFGVVTSQRAVSVGDVGRHSSSFAGERRLGLGNVARLFGFESVGELGSFLASIDELDATSCP